MRWEDIKSSIVRTIGKNIPGANIYFEEIDSPKKPYYFVDLVDFKKEFNTTHREWKSITLDIRYHPKSEDKFSRSGIIGALESLDDAFEIAGDKVLYAKKEDKKKTIEERWLALRDVDMTVVDKTGHYIFTLSMYDLYGNPYDYELMKDLELRMNKGVQDGTSGTN